MSEPERIVAAALIAGGVICFTPAPGRHHHVIHALAKNRAGEMSHGDQGFVTNTGRFVDREEGLAIAKSAGQIIKKNGNERELYSEDLW